jgi:hypothetical protein
VFLGGSSKIFIKICKICINLQKKEREKEKGNHKESLTLPFARIIYYVRTSVTIFIPTFKVKMWPYDPSPITIPKNRTDCFNKQPHCWSVSVPGTWTSVCKQEHVPHLQFSREFYESELFMTSATTATTFFSLSFKQCLQYNIFLLTPSKNATHLFALTLFRRECRENKRLKLQSSASYINLRASSSDEL